MSRLNVMDSRSVRPKRVSNGSFAVVAAKTSIVEFNRYHLSVIQSASESTISEDETILHYMAGAMFATILEDTILRLNIVDNCNNELRVRMTLQHMDSIVGKKYDVKPPANPEDIFRYPLECDENKVEKMFTDRKLFLNVLKQLYRELCTSKTYTRLLDFIKEKEIEAGHPLATEVEIKKNQCRELKHRLRSQRNVHKFSSYDSAEIVGKLQDLLNDTETTNTIKSRYMVNWKKALIEQHVQTINDSQDKHINSIRYYKTGQDGESRAHEEIERFNNIIIKELTVKVDTIMVKYEQGIEEFDLKIQIALSKLAEIQQRRQDMEQKFAKRQKEIDAWTKYTKERATKAASEKRKNDAAATVQAWWRGLLVRQKLGPFNPRQARAGKKKKGTGGSKSVQDDETAD